MSSGSRIAIIIAAAVVAIVVIVGGLMVAGVGLFWFRTTAHEDMAQREAIRALEEAMAQKADDVATLADREAAEPTVAATSDARRPLAERRREAIARGVAYLVKTQEPAGSWGEGNAGITALCADALLWCGKTAKDEPVSRAIAYLLKHQKDDGGIYDVGLKTYTTSIALMVLVKADAKTYAGPIEKAKAYLIKHQWDEAESIDKGNPWYGGHGYGQHERPDLSNTQYFVQAMHEAGVPKDHPLWKKVVVFVSRTQDRSESNDQMFAGTDSGGMIYSPDVGGESKAGTVDLPNGKKGLKAYGSMTYAGFKSFMYADLKRDDPRVQAAMEWIRRHWTFEENPDLGQQGLFYYYETAAKALKAWGEERIVDARRRTHDWRAELSETLLKRQKPDGFWINEADRWFEGFPPVPTSYALIALAHCE
ncbi:MAG TPA: hypothetical protein VM238_22285 [Phycisphaerae bacterium]|nr:hypothetical protein [Phycisphaerae bacterium]